MSATRADNAPTFRLADAFTALDESAWRAEVELALAGAPFAKKLVTQTYEGLSLQPLYSQAPPGAQPPLPEGWRVVTRHVVRPGMAAAVAEDLGRGAHGVTLAWEDAASDAPEVAAALPSLLAAIAAAGAQLDVEGGPDALRVASQVLAAAPAALPVNANLDPLGVLAAHGALPQPLAAALSEAAALAAGRVARSAPGRTLVVDLRPYQQGGAHWVQALAYALATGTTYLRQLVAQELSVAQAAAQIKFRFDVTGNFLMEIAALRAVRRLWQAVLAASDAAAAGVPLSLHVTPSLRVQTVIDPWMNLLRTSVAAFTAAIGGADDFTPLPFDALGGTVDGFSRRVARNTPIVLAEEAHLQAVVDPAAGSYAIETLTAALAEQAWTLFQGFEARPDGFAGALVAGEVQAAVAEVAAARARNVARRKEVVVGVNDFPGAAYREVYAPAPVAAAQAAALPLTRDASPFEALRAAAAAATAQGRAPKVFLANLGSVAEYTARANYGRNFFAVAGFEIHASEGVRSVAEIVADFVASGAKLVLLCSSNERYPALVPECVPALRAAGARTLVLAGHPGAQEASYRAAGVDHFIYVSCDVAEALRGFLREEGVL